MQFDGEGRGFSFRRDEPLDMRMDQTQGPTAADLLAGVDEQELADVIFQFGEERFSRRIARGIVEARRRAVTTTGQLAQHRPPGGAQRGYKRIDPATRTFQALRIWVNRELEGLDAFLVDASRRLRPAPGSRSSRSTRSRIASSSTRSAPLPPGRDALRVLTRKPVIPAKRKSRATRAHAARSSAPLRGSHERD